MGSPDSRSSAVVAGGTGALGHAVVRELLEDGREVTVPWIHQGERDRLRDDLGDDPRLRLVEADLTDTRGAEETIAAAGGSLGAVVSLVGGYSGGSRVAESDPGDLDRMLTLNVRPLFLLARAALPVLVEAGGGALLGVGARSALRPGGREAAYSASKAAVLALIRSIAAEYRDDGVRANAIVPSTIDTPANRRSMPRSDHSRWVPPEEIARVVRFLVSDDSRPTSGVAVPVYGRA